MPTIQKITTTAVAAEPIAPTWPAFWRAYTAVALAAYEDGEPHFYGPERNMSHADAAASRAVKVAEWFMSPRGYAGCNLQPTDAPFTWGAARALGLSPKVRTRKGLIAFFEAMGPCTPPVMWQAYRAAYKAACLADWAKHPWNGPKEGDIDHDTVADRQAEIACELLAGPALKTDVILDADLSPIMFSAAYALGFDRGNKWQSPRDRFIAFIEAMGPLS